MPACTVLCCCVFHCVLLLTRLTGLPCASPKPCTSPRPTSGTQTQFRCTPASRVTMAQLTACNPSGQQTPAGWQRMATLFTNRNTQLAALLLLSHSLLWLKAGPVVLDVEGNACGLHLCCHLIAAAHQLHAWHGPHAGGPCNPQGSQALLEVSLKSFVLAHEVVATCLATLPALEEASRLATATWQQQAGRQPVSFDPAAAVCKRCCAQHSLTSSCLQAGPVCHTYSVCRGGVHVV